MPYFAICLASMQGLGGALFPEDDRALRGSNSLLLVENMQGNPCASGTSRFPSEVPWSGIHRDSLACL